MASSLRAPAEQLDRALSSSREGDARGPHPAPAQPSGGKLRRAWRRHRFAYALIAPAVLFMLLIHLLPAAGGIVLSLKNLNTFTFSKLFGAPWNGLHNYRELLTDSASPLRSGFMDALRNTAIYTSVTVAGTLGGGLGVALLLNRPVRGARLLRTLALTPWIVPTFVVATLWQFMWQSDVGIIDKFLVDWTHILHHHPVWLVGSNTIWAIIVPSIWRGLPFSMLLCFAGLRAIPTELYEAAAIDGAGAWQRFRSITLPLLRPLLAIQLLFLVIYTTYQFVIPNVMLGNDPGPHADLLMTLIVRTSFSNNLVGVGAAASTLLMLGMAVWVAVWFLAFRRDLEATA
jgi:multiple sugar transport system permease protein